MRKFALAPIVRALFLVTGLAAPSSAFANSIQNMPLEKKVALSDVVFIGFAASENATNPDVATNDQFATVEPTAVLKGAPPKLIQVLVRGMIAEQNPNCCMRGKNYLFFLKRLSGTKYQSVNGPFGIYPMDTNGSEHH